MWMMSRSSQRLLHSMMLPRRLFKISKLRRAKKVPLRMGSSWSNLM